MKTVYDANWCLILKKDMKSKAMYNVKERYGVSLATFIRFVFKALNNNHDFSAIFKEVK